MSDVPEDIAKLAHVAAGAILTSAVSFGANGVAKLNHRKVADIVAQCILAERTRQALADVTGPAADNDGVTLGWFHPGAPGYRKLKY